MWKSKSFPIIVILIALLLPGCLSIEPTYNKEKIVECITALCKSEYGVEPRVWLLGESVWIYLPLSRLITKNLDWDKENTEKINKVMIGTSRVLLSMKPRPQFLVFIASDTQEYGLDYVSISWIPDIVKYQLQLISRDEFGRRHVTKIKENLAAIADLNGDHIDKREIKLYDFLAAQIAQRINNKFTLDAKIKDCFEVKDVYGIFQEDTFEIHADIKQTKPLPQGTINIQEEMNKIIAYVIKEYDFKDFLLVKIENPATGETTSYSRLALRQFLR